MAPEKLRIRSALFYSTFTRAHIPSRPTHLLLMSGLHPLYHRTKARHLAHSRNALWMQINCGMIKVKATLRNRCRRRFIEALRGALKEAGYDWHGRVLREIEGGNSRGTGLRGTLEVQGSISLLDADWGLVKEEASKMVSMIEIFCEKRPKS